MFDVLIELKTLIDKYDCELIFTSGIPNETPYVSKEELLSSALKLGYNASKLETQDFDYAVKNVLNNHNNCDIFIIGSFYVYNDVLKIITNTKG